MKPLISVIVPVYQVERYVAHCIESIVNQTYRNLEIICVVDDVPNDDSGKICDQYADQDKRIRVIHQENRGLSAARNRGLDVAKGEYIAFVDSDDYVGKQYIEEMHRIMCESQSNIVQCNFQEVIDDDAEENQRRGNYTVYSSREFSIATYTLLSWRCNVVWNKLYRASLFDEIRYPYGKNHEDEFTTYKLIWSADRVAITNMKLYFYRRRLDSLMGSKYSLKRLDAGEAFREREMFYQEKDETMLLNLVRREHLSWISWNLPLARECREVKQGLVLELEKEKEYLEKNTKDMKLYNKGLKFHGYLFPFSQIPYGSRIILYGAGDVGTQYYRQIIETNYCDVVAWVDMNFEKYRMLGFPVLGREETGWDEAEYIVIAIKDNIVAKEIINWLKNMYNIIKEKIVYEMVLV